jgi:propionyl-CoA carboxylase alpha chain
MLMAAVLAETRLRESEGGTFASELAVRLDGRSYRVSLRLERNGYLIDRDGASCFAATDWRPGNPLLHLRIDDRIATVQIERLPGRAFRLTHRGVIRRAQVLSPRAAELLAMMPEKAPADTSRMVLSPMPGLLTQVVVDEGQEVKAGEPLVVVEAMKMENVLRAERDGKVAKLCAKPGDSLAVDQVILEFE